MARPPEIDEPWAEIQNPGAARDGGRRVTEWCG